MSRIRKSLVYLGALAMVSTATVGLASGTASAASYNGACGSGYQVLDSRNISGATVYVTYNYSNGYNCVTTVRNTPGSAVNMGAAVKRSSDSTWVIDDDAYTTYAGPVYVHAPNQCIDWAGYYSSTSNQVIVTDDFCN